MMQPFVNPTASPDANALVSFASDEEQRRKDDYCLSLDLIEQASHLPGFNPMVVGMGTFSQVHLPLTEDVKIANLLQGQQVGHSCSNRPPDPQSANGHQIAHPPPGTALSIGKNGIMVLDNSNTSPTKSQGVGSKGFPTLIRDLSVRYQAHFICLFETHISGKKAELIAKKFGFSDWHLVEGVGFAGGIWCLWNSSY
ncbi:hypothetical protein PIB30_041598 [Stylosanthes scabra]|uniref:Uncharacterized protein n=1 Tax=Stylosanthes scabra TaxID=79078 RepID=A0ABU6VFP9_9FABA|nr:hypothetical protein [Stylosanthes scabra]